MRHLDWRRSPTAGSPAEGREQARQRRCFPDYCRSGPVKLLRPHPAGVVPHRQVGRWWGRHAPAAKLRPSCGHRGGCVGRTSRSRQQDASVLQPDAQLQPLRCRANAFHRDGPKKRLPEGFLQSVLGAPSGGHLPRVCSNRWTSKLSWVRLKLGAGL
jgi:hypothetical protein